MIAVGQTLSREERAASRRARIVAQCCVCSRFRDGDAWVHRTKSDDMSVTHTYCPECQDRVLAELDIA